MDFYGGILGATTTSPLNAGMATTTAFITFVTNQLISGTFQFIRFILPYVVVIGLLMVGLGIAWRVFRGVGKV